MGASAVTCRDASLPVVDLATEAATRAVADSGAPAVARRVDRVLVPDGTWRHADLGRAVAARLGAAGARSELGAIGVLQQTLLTRACEAVAAGNADVVLVCGGEAKHRAVLQQRDGAAPDPDPTTGAPDVVLRPDSDILTATEIEHDLATPAHQYALVERALASASGRQPGDQAQVVAELWACFARVAASNALAWDRSAPDVDAIRTPGPRNRMIAHPYTRRLCSQWNVDQAAALLVVSTATADALGIARDRRVFPVAAAESNLVVPLPCRHELVRWPAFEAVRDALLAGRPDPEVVDLYSCFPAAVQVQAAALGRALDEPLTVTGGMTYAGGPLNTYVLHALVTLVGRLREDHRALGLITSVSGMLTKPGASLWSATPPPEPFRAVDVTAEATTRTAVLPLDPDAAGGGRVVTATTCHGTDGTVRVVAVVDAGDVRTVATCTDAAVAHAVEHDDWTGRRVRLPVPGVLEPA